MKSQFSLKRILFLNLYGFVYLVCAAIVACIPFYRISWWVAAVQYAAVTWAIYKGLEVFCQWEYKKKKYNFLMRSFADGINEHLLRPGINLPCNRLIIYAVFKDLGKEDMYRPTIKRLKEQNALARHKEL